MASQPEDASPAPLAAGLSAAQAVTAGYGTSPFSGNSVNALGGGVGGRAGVSAVHVYLGAALHYYFGESADLGHGPFRDTSLLYGAEAGYGFTVGRAILRPRLGLGEYAVHTTWPGQSYTYGNVYVHPGVTGLVAFGPVLLGVDTGVLLLPGMDTSQAAWTIEAQAGARF